MKRSLIPAILLLCYISLFTSCSFLKDLSAKDTAAPAETGKPEETIANDITVEFFNNKQDFTNDDEIMLSYNSVSADVAVADNTSASDAICASLKSAYDSFYSQANDYAAEAAEWYNASKSGESFNWNSYIMARELTLGRSDARIISFIYDDFYYLGGAHGSTLVSAENYDVKTGEKLTLSDLSDDKQKLLDYALSYLLWLAEKPGFLDSFPWADGDSLKAIIEDGLWYLSPTGLVFICNEYSIGPYAAGMTFLEIPNNDLDNILLDKWLPVEDE